MPRIAGQSRYVDRTPRPARTYGPTPEATAWQAAKAALDGALSDPGVDAATLAELRAAEHAAWLAAHHGARSRPAAPILAPLPAPPPIVLPANPPARALPPPNRLFADSPQERTLPMRNGHVNGLAAAPPALPETAPLVDFGPLPVKPAKKTRRPATVFTDEQDAAILKWYADGNGGRPLAPLAAELGLPLDILNRHAARLRARPGAAPQRAPAPMGLDALIARLNRLRREAADLDAQIAAASDEAVAALKAVLSLDELDRLTTGGPLKGSCRDLD